MLLQPSEQRGSVSMYRNVLPQPAHPVNALPDQTPLVPYLTDDLPGVGGRIKSQPEDFVVEEIPLYLPSGEGEHLYLWIEKRDLSGERLLDFLSRALGIDRGEIGMAGLKDRQAVTRQYVSVPNRVADRIAQADTENVRVLETRRHANKLRTGHLAGNRFDILIRDPAADAVASLESLLSRVNALGFPNAYGSQRFGRDQETLHLGLGLLRGERHERSIPFKRRKFLLRLALSAVQSLLFNQVLAARLGDGTLHRAEGGDVMQVVASGGCFLVEDVPAEQARYDRRETVMTGPIFGPKMKRAAGRPGELEQLCLERSGLTLAHFARYAKLTPGARRPLLVWPQELSGVQTPDGVRLRFTLPSGAYATTLLREVMKVDLPEE